MKNCLVCGTPDNSAQFGSYCSAQCRDSDIAVFGKTFWCEHCGDEFKALSKKNYCLNCLKEMNNTVAVCEAHSSQPVSDFKYSIFEDNIERIMLGATKNDKRNCNHATHEIIRNIDSSMMPKIVELLEHSNAQAKVWFIDILSRLNDRRAIHYLEKCLSTHEDETVQLKAMEAINTLENAY
jgi:HEAT repeat protein